MVYGLLYLAVNEVSLIGSHIAQHTVLLAMLVVVLLLHWQLLHVHIIDVHLWDIRPGLDTNFVRMRLDNYSDHLVQRWQRLVLGYANVVAVHQAGEEQEHFHTR